MHTASLDFDLAHTQTSKLLVVDVTNSDKELSLTIDLITPQTSVKAPLSSYMISSMQEIDHIVFHSSMLEMIVPIYQLTTLTSTHGSISVTPHPSCELITINYIDGRQLLVEV